MSPTTRGGAKLGHGLAIEDGALGIGEVTDPTDAGPIVALSAKGWAEQDTTVGKNLVALGEGTWTYSGITFKTHTNASIEISGTATAEIGYASFNYLTHLSAGTYTLSGCTSDLQRLNVYKYANGSPTYIGSDMGSGYTFTLSEDTDVYVYPIVPNGATIDTTIYPQIEAGSTATSYEPYSGGAPSPSPSYPQEIKVCTGRNLFDASTAIIGKAWNLSNNSARAIVNVEVEPSTTYTISNISGGFSPLYVYEKASASDTTNITSYDVNARTSRTITTGASTRCICVQFNKDAIRLSDITVEQVQLEAGSTAHPYVPYGCVGVDVTHDGTTTTIPIPLPSRGWVAALPDGTADTLALDGAGGYVWELRTGEYVIDGSTYKSTGKAAYANGYRHGIVLDAGCDTSNRVNFYTTHFVPSTRALASDRALVGDAIIYPLYDVPTLLAMSSIQDIADFNAWLAENPVTVLYALTTPTTESGYVSDMPTVPAHASISCPDLTDLAVRCCADEGAAEIAAAWYNRAYAELSDAIVDLAARVAQLEG